MKKKGLDVLLSKKIVFSIMGVPVLWITYALLLWTYTSLEPRTIIVMLLCCPLFSYLGVMTVEAGMVDIKDLRPVFLRLLPSFKELPSTLPQKRAALQHELRAVVKKYGPELGSLYFDVEVGPHALCLFHSLAHPSIVTRFCLLAGAVGELLQDRC